MDLDEWAKKEYVKIISEANDKTIEIMDKAKKEGIWKPGLDSNNDLFTKIKDEAKEKIKRLINEFDKRAKT